MVDKFARKIVKNNERFLVFWCLVVRVSENESLERTLGEQDSLINTRRHKRLQFLLCLFLGILRSFMNIN